MDFVMSPTDFVAVFNQTVSVAYPVVTIEGEVANYRVSKGKWVYFDIKDEYASLRVFGTIFQLRHAITDGMIVSLVARPELHPLYNFSLQLQDVIPKGEGSIKKSFDLLHKKLEAEGLFDISRKRILPYPPQRVGLITSAESAAYTDFLKVFSARWPLAEIELIDTKVQGADAAGQIVAALHHFNLQAEPVEVVVIIRGGGSADDLVAFADESLTRTVAESRVPTLVAIGHERDISLAELAADVRASTPSNAAELLVPSRAELLDVLRARLNHAREIVASAVDLQLAQVKQSRSDLETAISMLYEREETYLKRASSLIAAYDPRAVLKRGYSLVKMSGRVVSSKSSLKKGDEVTIEFHDGQETARII